MVAVSEFLLGGIFVLLLIVIGKLDDIKKTLEKR